MVIWFRSGPTVIGQQSLPEIYFSETMEDDLRWKTTFYGRQPSIEDDLQWLTTFDVTQPIMKDKLRWETTFIGR